MAGRKPVAAARDEELYWSEQSSEGGSRETIVVNTAEETEEGAQKQGERGRGLRTPLTERTGRGVLCRKRSSNRLLSE